MKTAIEYGYNKDTVFVDMEPPYVPNEIWWFATRNHFTLPLNAERCNLIWQLIYPELASGNDNLLVK